MMNLVFVLFAAFVITASATKKAHSAPAAAHRDVCYSKVERCCHMFKACGIKVAKKKLFGICPVKQCKKECFDVCFTKIVKGKKEHCVKTVTYKKQCFKHPWEPEVCTKVPTYKKTCTKSTKKVKICENKCNTNCDVVAKKCSIIKTFHFTKFCPRLFCSTNIIGSATKPTVIVAKTGKFVKKTKVIPYGKAVPHVW